tara:strand:- start:1490 stop:1660 length:171 start_codon:yes stop_codon:yes gene_type:complete
MHTLSEEHYASIHGGSIASMIISSAGVIGTYIMILDYAESFGEGLGEGLYDGLNEE